MGKLGGKVAVITGGSSGIGLATAHLFAGEGAHVVLVGKQREAVAEAAARLGKEALGVAADVANLDDLDRLYETIARKMGRVDIVVANAGIARVAPFPAISAEHFEREFNVNVRGVFFTVQKALPLMADGGSIILMSSVANAKGYPLFSLYAGTKAAVRSFARGWTNDLKDRRIRVNSISPGPIDTPMPSKLGLPDEMLAPTVAGFVAQIPMGRMGHADEVARAALFLASEDSSFVTGIDLPVDGGVAQV